ncbi:MAG TPA: S24 family peptidase, partial [Rubricoccaceae bacterium]|nr:S24 family peptidase [Rubricoccaceae bacterium]
SDDPFAFDDGPPSLPLISQTSSREPEHLRRRPLGSLHVDPRLLGRADPDGCLVAVAGDDGMNSAGIRKNDLLVVEEAPWKDVRNDELVAALLGERLVVRRFEVANGRLHLRAAEKRYADESFAPDDDGCHVVGRVLAVMRKL